MKLTDHPLINLLRDTANGHRFSLGLPYYIAYHSVGHETLEYAVSSGLVDVVRDEGQENERYPCNCLLLTAVGKQLLEAVSEHQDQVRHRTGVIRNL